jgi:hypothetical protein
MLTPSTVTDLPFSAKPSVPSTLYESSVRALAKSSSNCAFSCSETTS